MKTAGKGNMNNIHTEKDRICQICGSTKISDLRRGILVSPAVAALIQKETGSWSNEGWICADDINKYRHEYVKALLETERGELSALDKEVLESLRQQEILSENPEEELQSGLTAGQRMADRLTNFTGSWRFIISFGVILLLWILLNSAVLIIRPFDPYPFILLNLVLSCLAAIQAPVIMMSQVRQENRDRLYSRHDYQVNLKAELEVRHLHQKLDHLLTHQWERLVEIQEMQIELINEMRSRK